MQRLSCLAPCPRRQGRGEAPPTLPLLLSGGLPACAGSTWVWQAGRLMSLR